MGSAYRGLRPSSGELPKGEPVRPKSLGALEPRTGVLAPEAPPSRCAAASPSLCDGTLDGSTSGVISRLGDELSAAPSAACILRAQILSRRSIKGKSVV
jgi:hypothetical protein